VKLPPSAEFGGGEWYSLECQGVVVWSCKFNRSWGDPPTDVYPLGLTWIGLVVGEIRGKEFPPQYNLRFLCGVPRRTYTVVSRAVIQMLGGDERGRFSKGDTKRSLDCVLF